MRTTRWRAQGDGPPRTARSCGRGLPRRGTPGSLRAAGSWGEPSGAAGISTEELEPQAFSLKCAFMPDNEASLRGNLGEPRTGEDRRKHLARTRVNNGRNTPG